MQNISQINRQILAMYPEEWVCYGNPSENPSKPLQRAGIGVGARRYLYRPNVPEGCIDIPDQCIGFFSVAGACREKFWSELIRYSSPTRYREIFWGNMICINCVDDGN